MDGRVREEEFERGLRADHNMVRCRTCFLDVLNASV